MISLIDLFLYEESSAAPTPQKSTGLKSVAGWIDAQLQEDVKSRAREHGLSDNEVNASAFSAWLEATTGG